MEYKILGNPQRFGQNISQRHKSKVSLPKILGLIAIPIAIFGAGLGIAYHLDTPVSVEKVNIDGIGQNDDLRIRTRRGEIFEVVYENGGYRLISQGEKAEFEKQARIKYSIDNKIELR